MYCDSVPSIKPVMSYYSPMLFEMYKYTTKYADLPDEELRKYFDNETMEYIHKFPKVTDTLKYIGKLRISWSLDLKYNKNIDLIFFPEDNPYINYAILYAKGSPKISKYLFGDEDLFKKGDTGISYDINYDFVKEVFKQSELSPTQQERFFNSRFGGVFIPMEIEFEWFGIQWYDYNYYKILESNINKIISFLKNDEYLKMKADDYLAPSICFGIIKSYKILPSNTPITFPKDILNVEGSEYIECPTYAELLTPLPTSALAYTYTNIDDFIVNVRDKPNTKEGKIVAQLLSQRLSPKLLVPTFQKINIENRREHEWQTFDDMFEELKNYYKIQKAYYTKEKANLINPLDKDEYLVLVWNIESNGWAKVWILLMIDENGTPIKGNEKLKQKSDSEYSLYGLYKISNSSSNFIHNYQRTFLEHPSRLKLYEGYIHTSGLEYFTPFGGNYIQK